MYVDPAGRIDPLAHSESEKVPVGESVTAGDCCWIAQPATLLVQGVSVGEAPPAVISTACSVAPEYGRVFGSVIVPVTAVSCCAAAGAASASAANASAAASQFDPRAIRKTCFVAMLAIALPPARAARNIQGRFQISSRPARRILPASMPAANCSRTARISIRRERCSRATESSAASYCTAPAAAVGAVGLAGKPADGTATVAMLLGAD